MATDNECLVCAAGSDIAKLASSRMQDMPPLRLVLPTEANARRARVDHYLSVNQVNVAETLELDAMLGTLDIVANSDWVTVLPGILGRADRDGTKRRFMPLQDPPLSVDYMRISHKARPLNRAAQAFFDTLHEELDAALRGE